MIRSLLEAAHKSSDPLVTLESLLVDHPTKKMVDMLVPNSIELYMTDSCNLLTDIEAYLNDDEEYSPIGWRCKFLYFATSMCHVFGHGDFYPEHVITYVKPNEPMPYVWLNLTSNCKVELIQRWRCGDNGFTVIVHAISRVNDLKTTRFNVGKGSDEALQISLRLDLLEGGITNLIARLTRPHPSMDCVVMLTFNGKFSGIYYKTKQPLIANTIANPATKS